MIRKTAWFLLFAFLAFSCLDDPDCFNLNNNVIGISFRKMADDRADTVALVGVSVAGTDSVFYEFTLANGVQIPLNYLENESLLTFVTASGSQAVSRGLRVGYDSKIQYVSPDCGQRFVVGDLKVLASEFDSVRLISDTPSASPGTNIIIYRCPVTNVSRMVFRQLYADDDSIGDPLDVTVSRVAADYLSEPLYLEETASSFRLPVNPEANSTSFTFTFPDGDKSITVGYTAVPEELFTVCGTQLFYTNLTVTDTDFEFYEVSTDSIFDPPATNVVFYRCPETNLIRLDFKRSAAENALSEQVALNGVTDDFSGVEYYADTTLSSLILPVNTLSSSTAFLIEFDDGSVKELTVGYTREERVYHDVCNQTLVSDLRVVTSGFTTPPRVVNASAEYPAVSNFAIVND